MVEIPREFSQGFNQGWTWRSCVYYGSKMGGSIRYFAEGGKARPAGFLRADVTKFAIFAAYGCFLKIPSIPDKNTYYLGIEKENVTQMDIANQIGIDKMLTSNVLKALIKKDLIKREEHKIDTRATVIRLSKPGQLILKKAVKEVENFDKLFFSKLANNRTFTSELIELLNKENFNPKH